jgi:hypothetical protein
MSCRGKILSVEDGGSVWTLFYRTEEGEARYVIFDWRQLSDLYDGTSGKNFYHDYKFGRGRDIISQYFKGKTLIVDGEEFEEKVGLED